MAKILCRKYSNFGRNLTRITLVREHNICRCHLVLEMVPLCVLSRQAE